MHIRGTKACSTKFNSVCINYHKQAKMKTPKPIKVARDLPPPQKLSDEDLKRIDKESEEARKAVTEGTKNLEGVLSLELEDVEFLKKRLAKANEAIKSQKQKLYEALKAGVDQPNANADFDQLISMVKDLGNNYYQETMREWYSSGDDFNY